MVRILIDIMCEVTEFCLLNHNLSLNLTQCCEYLNPTMGCSKVPFKNVILRNRAITLYGPVQTLQTKHPSQFIALYPAVQLRTL